MSSTMTGGFGRAIQQAWERRDAEERDRYAIEKGERRRVLREISPCTFLGRSLSVSTELAEHTPEAHTLRIGRLSVDFTAFYGKFSWKLGYDDSSQHFTIASASHYGSGEWTPASCMVAAEAALREFQARVAALGAA